METHLFVQGNRLPLGICGVTIYRGYICGLPASDDVHDTGVVVAETWICNHLHPPMGQPANNPITADKCLACGMSKLVAAPGKPELKPCPFCGCIPVRGVEVGNDELFRIKCPDCPAGMKFYSTTFESDCAARWNTRAPQPAVERLLALLKTFPRLAGLDTHTRAAQLTAWGINNEESVRQAIKEVEEQSKES